ncbi:MAG: hypothetical protein H0T92_24160 [Pyrinomonadaceae bacterium]|nr:hypothetical protein [Pyrinomonadaceae bacterium]
MSPLIQTRDPETKLSNGLDGHHCEDGHHDPRCLEDDTVEWDFTTSFNSIYARAARAA